MSTIIVRKTQTSENFVIFTAPKQELRPLFHLHNPHFADPAAVKPLARRASTGRWRHRDFQSHGGSPWLSICLNLHNLILEDLGVPA